MSNIFPIKPGAAVPVPPKNDLGQRLELCTPENMGPEKLLAIDSLVAEVYGTWERREVDGVWKWRRPRDHDHPGPQEWQDSPPRFTEMESHKIFTMTDALANAAEMDLMVSSVMIPVPDNPEMSRRCYIVMLGRAQLQGAFTARHVALASTLQLGCCLVLCLANPKTTLLAITEEMFGPMVEPSSA